MVDFHKTPLAKRWGFYFTLLLASIPSQVALADDGADLGQIDVTATSEYESLEETGAFTSVVKPQTSKKRSKTTPEILSEAVGIDVTSLGGEGQISTTSIRGSSAEQVAVFVDGIKINSALYGSVDFATIPIDSIERIEVIRGASSARFGTDAIGGVINIVTKKTKDKRDIDLKLTTGSYETLKLHGAWSEPFDNIKPLVSFNHFSSGGDFPFKGAPVSLDGQQIGPTRTYTRLHNRSISEDVLTKVSIDITEKARFSFSNDFFWTDRQVPGTEDETTVLYPTNPLEANETIFRDSTGANFDLDEFFTPSISWEAGATYVYDHDHFTDPSPAVGNPIDTTYATQSPNGHMQWTHAINNKFLNVATTLRYEYDYDRSNNKSPFSYTPEMGVHTRQTNAGFLEQTAGFFGDRLLVMPQVRVEKATSRNFRSSWRVGLTGKPINWIDLKTNVYTSFRYPNFSELYFPDQGYLRGNPDLEDERALSWDAGFIVHPKYFSLGLSYFQNRIDNQILFVPVSAYTIQPVNTFKVFAQGVEIEATVDPIKEFSLKANYAFLNAQYSGTNVYLPGRPKHKVNVLAEGRIKPVTLFGRLDYLSSFPVNTANTVWISGHVAMDAGTTVDISKYFFATFEVKDITNVQIYDARAFPLPRRSYWFTIGANT